MSNENDKNSKIEERFIEVRTLPFADAEHIIYSRKNYYVDSNMNKQDIRKTLNKLHKSSVPKDDNYRFRLN